MSQVLLQELFGKFTLMLLNQLLLVVKGLRICLLHILRQELSLLSRDILCPIPDGSVIII